MQTYPYRLYINIERHIYIVFRTTVKNMIFYMIFSKNIEKNPYSFDNLHTINISIVYFALHIESG